MESSFSRLPVRKETAAEMPEIVLFASDVDTLAEDQEEEANRRLTSSALC
jgi:hypothetical protein